MTIPLEITAITDDPATWPPVGADVLIWWGNGCNEIAHRSTLNPSQWENDNWHRDIDIAVAKFWAKIPDPTAPR